MGFVIKFKEIFKNLFGIKKIIKKYIQSFVIQACLSVFSISTNVQGVTLKIYDEIVNKLEKSNITNICPSWVDEVLFFNGAFKYWFGIEGLTELSRNYKDVIFTVRCADFIGEYNGNAPTMSDYTVRKIIVKNGGVYKSTTPTAELTDEYCEILDFLDMESEILFSND